MRFILQTERKGNKKIINSINNHYKLIVNTSRKVLFISKSII